MRREEPEAGKSGHENERLRKKSERKTKKDVVRKRLRYKINTFFNRIFPTFGVRQRYYYNVYNLIILKIIG